MIKRIKVICLVASFWLIMMGSSSILRGIDLGYLDELIVICLLPLVVLKLNTEKKYLKLWLYVLGFIGYCLFFGYTGVYNRGLKLIGIDIFLFLKPILFILLFIQISYNTRLRFIRSISYTGSIYVYIAFIFYLINLAFNILPTFEYRLGIHAYKFIAGTPGEFLNNLVIIGSFIIIDKKTKKKIPLFILAFLILGTLRGKAIVMFFLALLIFYYFNKIRSRHNLDLINQNINKLLKKPQFLILIGLGLIPGWFQFKYYFLSADISPRLLLHITAFNLTHKFFPIGAGPGTFGSAVARQWYSPVYTNHGFREIFGLDGNDPSFLSDSYWPMVFAQYGVIGFILIIAIYKGVIGICSTKLATDKYVFEIFLITLLSLILSTLGSAILIGSIGILYMMLLGSLVNTQKPLK